jgi:hypothetical protein
MNERIEHCLYQSGLTAQGCWDELDDYAKQGIEKFAELIVQECVAICKDIDGEDNTDARSGRQDCAVEIREHFGVDE